MGMTEEGVPNRTAHAPGLESRSFELCGDLENCGWRIQAIHQWDGGETARADWSIMPSAISVKSARHFNLRGLVTILCDTGPSALFRSGGDHLSDLEQILAKSRAAEPFKRAVKSYGAGGGQDHIRVDGYAPSIKVRRLLAHMLAVEAHLPIERISLRGRSGCSDFVGTVQVHTASETRVYEFVWDCRWRAEQEGWTDCFGFPDQIRAAREYDWRCFERWEAVHVDTRASHVLE
jgi:hypothetical protein